MAVGRELLGVRLGRLGDEGTAEEVESAGVVCGTLGAATSVEVGTGWGTLVEEEVVLVASDSVAVETAEETELASVDVDELVDEEVDVDEVVDEVVVGSAEEGAGGATEGATYTVVVTSSSRSMTEIMVVGTTWVTVVGSAVCVTVSPVLVTIKETVTTPLLGLSPGLPFPPPLWLSFSSGMRGTTEYLGLSGRAARGCSARYGSPAIAGSSAESASRRRVEACILKLLKLVGARVRVSRGRRPVRLKPPSAIEMQNLSRKINHAPK